MRQCMLSTMDNPYDPFTQFDQWYHYDEVSGYKSLNFLARIAIYSDEMPQAMQHRIIEEAIDEIVAHNVLGIYKKVVKDSEDSGD